MTKSRELFLSCPAAAKPLISFMHLIDLTRWFLGDLLFVAGRAPTYFWDMPVEDNAFFLLETKSNQVAMLHASWTEWKTCSPLRSAAEWEN